MDEEGFCSDSSLSGFTTVSKNDKKGFKNEHSLELNTKDAAIDDVDLDIGEMKNSDPNKNTSELFKDPEESEEHHDNTIGLPKNRPETDTQISENKKLQASEEKSTKSESKCFDDINKSNEQSDTTDDKTNKNTISSFSDTEENGEYVGIDTMQPAQKRFSCMEDVDEEGYCNNITNLSKKEARQNKKDAKQNKHNKKQSKNTLDFAEECSENKDICTMENTNNKFDFMKNLAEGDDWDTNESIYGVKKTAKQRKKEAKQNKRDAKKNEFDFKEDQDEDNDFLDADKLETAKNKFELINETDNCSDAMNKKESKQSKKEARQSKKEAKKNKKLGIVFEDFVKDRNEVSNLSDDGEMKAGKNKFQLARDEIDDCTDANDSKPVKSSFDCLDEDDNNDVDNEDDTFMPTKSRFVAMMDCDECENDCSESDEDNLDKFSLQNKKGNNKKNNNAKGNKNTVKNKKKDKGYNNLSRYAIASNVKDNVSNKDSDVNDEKDDCNKELEKNQPIAMMNSNEGDDDKLDKFFDKNKKGNKAQGIFDKNSGNNNAKGNKNSAKNKKNDKGYNNQSRYFMHTIPNDKVNEGNESDRDSNVEDEAPTKNQFTAMMDPDESDNGFIQNKKGNNKNINNAKDKKNLGKNKKNDKGYNNQSRYLMNNAPINKVYEGNESDDVDEATTKNRFTAMIDPDECDNNSPESDEDKLDKTYTHNKKGNNNAKGNKNLGKYKKNDKGCNNLSRYSIVPNNKANKENEMEKDSTISKENEMEKDSNVSKENEMMKDSIVSKENFNKTDEKQESADDGFELTKNQEMLSKTCDEYGNSENSFQNKQKGDIGSINKDENSFQNKQKGDSGSINNDENSGTNETSNEVENKSTATIDESLCNIIIDPFLSGRDSEDINHQLEMDPYISCIDLNVNDNSLDTSCVDPNNDKTQSSSTDDMTAKASSTVLDVDADGSVSYPSCRDLEADGGSTYTSCIDVDTDGGNSYPSSMEADPDSKLCYTNCDDVDMDTADPSPIETYPFTEIDSSINPNTSVPDSGKKIKRIPSKPKPKHGIRISLNLIKAAKKYMKFLKSINNLDLYDGPRVKAAIYRYESFWLPLLSRNDDKSLIAPPIDVHWIWIVHMLAPHQYNDDCITLVGKLLPHRILSSNALLNAQEGGEILWTESYPEEPWDLAYEDVGNSRYIHLSSISYDLASAVKRQGLFYYQICLPHYECKIFLRKAICRYRQFIKLKNLYPDNFLVPTYDIDLMWHTHQLHPFIYRNDCMNLLGCLFPHDDSVNNREEGSKLRSCDQKTRELWCKTYGTTLRQDASMFRGDPPNTYLEHMPSLIENSARSVVFVVKITKIRIKGKFKKGHLRLRIKQEEPISCSTIDLVQFTLFHCGSKDTEHFVSDRDISFVVPQEMCCNYIVLKVNYKQRLQKLVNFFKQESFWSMSNFKDLFNGDVTGEIVKKFKDDKTGTYIELNMHVTKKLCYTWVPISIFTGKFLPVCLDPDLMCSMYGITAVHQGYKENSFTADRAIHRLFDDSSPKRPELFEVWVTHSFQFMLSSIEIFALADQKETIPVCLAHTVDLNTLPSSELFKNFQKECFPQIDAKKAQRAIIIKTAKGDYAIIVGWWEGRKQGVQASFSKRGIKGEPGNLVIRVWKLSSESEPYTVSLPYERRKFILLANNIRIDLKNGKIKVSDDTEDFIEHLAFGLAISTLHVLVEPRQYVGGDEIDSGKATKAKPRRIPSESLPLLAALGFACAAAPTNAALMNHDNNTKGTVMTTCYPLLGDDAGCGSCGGCGGCGGGGANDAAGPIGWSAGGATNSGHGEFDSGAGDASGGGDIGFFNLLVAGDGGVSGYDGGDGGDAGGCGGCGGCGG